MANSPKIAIAGAGPAGLTLARLLHVSNASLSVTVYERDVSPTSRPDQGGTLDLHADTGLAAIRSCGLWNEFRRYARYDGEEKTIADKNATVLAHMSAPGDGGGEGRGGRPEIDRGRLKEVLVESVPENLIVWGRKLKEVTSTGMLRFEGREELDGPFDVVVGADGAWSKVRAILNPVEPSYAGVSGYEMEIKDAAKTCLHVDKMVGQGSYFGSSDQKFLNAQRMGDGSIKVRSWFICAEDEAKDSLELYGQEGMLSKILHRYRDWAPEMTELLRQAEVESLRHWTLYELPVGYKWEHLKGFTLIGDAASLATPFSGEGVNKAMKDASELARMIINSQEGEDITLDEAIQIYEQEMFPRTEKLQALTMANKLSMFGSDAPIGFMTGTLKRMTAESPSAFVRILGTRPVVAMLYSYLWIRQQIGWAVRKFWRRT